MRLLRWLIVAASLSLLALSMSLHYRLDDRFADFGAPSATFPTDQSERTISVQQFGSEQTLSVTEYKNRSDALRACGEDNIMQWEVITRTESKDGGYSCRSDLR
jgi:hypothetical protein